MNELQRRVFKVKVMPLAEVERRHVMNVFKLFGGNIARTARELGVTRMTIYRKLAAYGEKRP